ncbi:MAG TPA: hypothetical protein VGL35_00910 [Rhizomicrobium sp.]|jgi:hypothetical protein
MKLTFLPTLTDLHEMLGDRLYLEFVWMWREQEQAQRTQERRAKWAEQLPARNAEAWPQPLFIRAEAESPRAPEQKPAQVALLHPNIQRLLEQRTVNGADWLQLGPDPEAEAIASRVRAAGYRAAAE